MAGPTDAPQPKTRAALKTCIADKLDFYGNDPVAGRRASIAATADGVIMSVEKGNIMGGGDYKAEGLVAITGLDNNNITVTGSATAGVSDDRETVTVTDTPHGSMTTVGAKPEAVNPTALTSPGAKRAGGMAQSYVAWGRSALNDCKP